MLRQQLLICWVFSDKEKLFSITGPPRRSQGGQRVVITVSGTMYETLESTLARFPYTLLGCREKRERLVI